MTVRAHRAEDHRQVQSGAARAVFGVSDGLTTSVSLILGVAGANSGSSFVHIACLFASAFSMAAGEYISMRAESELLNRELNIEEAALLADPDAEQQELAAIYRTRGLDQPLADQVAKALSRAASSGRRTDPAFGGLGVDPSTFVRRVSLRLGV
jgi:VIT1/CCC1 family predicted Fe2+/Mn2+ transporter